MSFRYYYTGTETQNLENEIAVINTQIATLNSVVGGGMLQNNPIALANIQMNGFVLSNVGNGINSNNSINKGQLDATYSNLSGQINNLSSSTQSNINSINNNISIINGNISNINSNITNINNNITNINNTLPLKADLSGANFSGSVSIAGNLVVNGTSTTINSTNSNISDNLVQIGANNIFADTVDAGVYMPHFKNGAIHYMGWYRKATQNRFKFFETREPPNGLNINEAGAGYTLRELEATQITLSSDASANDQAVRLGQLANYILKTSASTVQNTAGNIDLIVGSTLLGKYYTFSTNELSINNSKITLLANGTSALDAVNKQQLDALNTSIGSNYLPLTGGTLTGNLVISGANHFKTTVISSATSSGINVLNNTGDNTFAISNSTINSYLGHQIHGIGIGTNGRFSGNITNGNISDISRTRNLFIINNVDTASGQVLNNINWTGDLLDYQTLKLYNNSSVDIYINSTGNIRALPHTVIPRKQFIELMYNGISGFGNWIVVNPQNVNSILYNNYYYRWKNDNLLNILIPSSGTYVALLNFNNSVNLTINGISGWTNITGNTTQTNYTITFTGTPDTAVNQNSNPSTFLQSTESNKFRGLLYNFTDMTIALNQTALTFANYYQVIMFYLDWNGDSSRRSFKFEDMDVKPFTHNHEIQSWPNDGTVYSYIFQNIHKSTTVRFKLTNISGGHLYGMAVRNLGATLSP